jgi:hypothetical protein
MQNDLNDMEQSAKKMESDLKATLSGVENVMSQFKAMATETIPTEVFSVSVDGQKCTVERYGNKVSMKFETEKQAIDHISYLKDHAR